MKKTKLIFTVLISFVIILLSGCLPSSYYEDWEEIEGYAVTKTVQSARTQDTTSQLEDFVICTPDKIPEGESIAVLYKHVLGSSSNPYCQVTIYKPGTNIDTNTVDEYIEHYSERFYITKNTKFVKSGLIFYVDDEYCYVINDLYQYGYRDYNEIRPKAPYYIDISISGMRDIPFYMTKTAGFDPLN